MPERFTFENCIKNGVVSASKKYFHGNADIHWHEFYEIEYIVSGSGEYVIDNRKYTMNPGMIFFMTPANFHSVQAEDVVLYNVMFSGSVCNPLYLSPLLKNSGTGVLLESKKDRNYIEAVFTQLTDESNKEEYSLFIDCLVAMICRYTDTACEDRLSVSQAALAYIAGNFRSNVSLKDVASHIGISPTYLSETFKRQTGIGFKQYLNDLRFEYARKLLLFSDMSISQICSESGFDDLTNFIRRFTSRFGISPSKYRKSQRNGDV